MGNYEPIAKFFLQRMKMNIKKMEGDPLEEEISLLVIAACAFWMGEDNLSDFRLIVWGFIEKAFAMRKESKKTAAAQALESDMEALK